VNAPLFFRAPITVRMPRFPHGVALAQQIRTPHPDVAVLYASRFPSSALAERRQVHIDGPLLNKGCLRRMR
jgi:hypothetical protein